MERSNTYTPSHTHTHSGPHTHTHTHTGNDHSELFGNETSELLHTQTDIQNDVYEIFKTLTRPERSYFEHEITKWLQSTRYKMCAEERAPFVHMADVSLAASLVGGVASYLLVFRRVFPRNKTLIQPFIPATLMAIWCGQTAANHTRQSAYTKLLNMNTPFTQKMKNTLSDIKINRANNDDSSHLFTNAKLGLPTQGYKFPDTRKGDTEALPHTDAYVEAHTDAHTHTHTYTDASLHTKSETNEAAGTKLQQEHVSGWDNSEWFVADTHTEPRSADTGTGVNKTQPSYPQPGRPLNPYAWNSETSKSFKTWDDIRKNQT